MVRFKYSFTLWVEENGLPFFVLPTAVALCVTADTFNSFNGGLYFFINIVGFVIGYILGLIAWITTAEWIRNHTLWHGDWENKYSKAKIPIRFYRSKREESSGNLNHENKTHEDQIDKATLWQNIHLSLAFGNIPTQTFLFFLVSLILIAYEYSQFKEYGLTYSARVLLDSSAFFIAFFYLSNPLFQFIKYMLVMLPGSSDYTDGSFWQKFFLFRVLIINSIIYGYTAYYTHQLFLTFE